MVDFIDGDVSGPAERSSSTMIAAEFRGFLKRLFPFLRDAIVRGDMGAESVIAQDMAGHDLFLLVRITAPMGKPLTRRQREIWEALREDLEDKEICTKLRMENSTLRTHLRLMLAQYSSRSRTGLAVKRLDLIHPPEPSSRRLRRRSSQGLRA